LRLLYGVSPIGLGHATRAVAVADELRKKGVDVRFASGGNAAEFIRSSGYAVEDVVREPTPAVSDGEMKRTALWYLQYWRDYRGSRGRLGRVLEDAKPDAVVGDEEFSSVSLAIEKGLSQALITDELQLSFARGWLARQFESRAAAWYDQLQRRVGLLIIPEAGTDAGNRRFVGPVVREKTRDRQQVIEEHGLPKEGKMILLSLSGSGLGTHLLERTSRVVSAMGESAFLVVAGNRGRKLERGEAYDLGVVKDNQNLVAAADLVVSTAGKSTIDEAASFGTPIVAIPIRNHAEQERNASALGYSPEDLGRIPELIRKKLSGGRNPPLHFEGARLASELLASLA
jgi:UDP-N-acetylglucosamine--N-acetylmuramyl-(pentapeptide) pyrophosphoryl-undecaprenol N-acetylglucosamine transferase